MLNISLYTGLRIPEDYLLFKQEEVFICAQVTYYLNWKNNNNVLEIKNSPKSALHLCGAIGGLQILVCLLIFLLYYYLQDAFVLLFALVSFMWWFILPLDYYHRRKCREFWNTGTNDVRCSFNLNSGELFFSKEKVTYKQEEYKYICLACIYGIPYDYRPSPPLMPQLSMLVLLNDGTWKRHLLTEDALIIYKKKLRKYSQYFQCPVILKDSYGKYEIIDESTRLIPNGSGRDRE